MPSIKVYKQYIIGRNFIKSTSYENINTGRRRRAAQNQPQNTPMTTQELDLAYQYRQRAKREKLLRLADVNFEAGACVLATLTFKENLRDYDTAVKAFKLFTKRLRRKLEDVHYIATLEIQNHGAFHFFVWRTGSSFSYDITPFALYAGEVCHGEHRLSTTAAEGSGA